jgi:phosphoglycolate phosphatase-like HAD superfamily hydrolase
MAKRAGPVAEDGVFVVGDTPHDIACATHIGARTIAVTTGDYTLEELQPHRPWRVFSTLPPPEDFLALIESTRARPTDIGGQSVTA